MNYAHTLGLPKLPLGETMVADKTTLALLADSTAENILSIGNEQKNEQEFYVRLKVLEQYCGAVLSRIKDRVTERIKEQPLENDGFTLGITHTVKYDYSANNEWQRISSEEEKAALERKAIEEAMRKSGTAKKVSEEASPKFTLGKK